MVSKVCFISNTFNDLVNAQVAIESLETWTVIANRQRASGLKSFGPMPQVFCPVVDVSGVQDDEAVLRVVKQWIGPEGVRDVAALCKALQDVGAVVNFTVAQVS
jgi:hypothetical protein